MSKRAIDEFAEKLVEYVRDEAIAACKSELHQDAQSVRARRWRKAAVGGIVPAEAVIADCIDETLFQLLRAIDEEQLRLLFLGSSGRKTDLSAAGESELTGRYLMTGGWIAQHSRQEYFDDFADLVTPSSD